VEYKISKAALQDVAQLNHLVNSAYRGESSRKGWTTEADFLDGIRVDEEALREIISKPNAQILQCMNDRNEITGCVHLEKQGSRLYLGMLTVSPTLQNQGIGKLFLREADEEARKQNCDAIYMTVLSERVELIGWYERYGYANTGRKKPFPMNDPRFGLPKKFIEFIVMEKKISSTPPSSDKPPLL